MAKFNKEAHKKAWEAAAIAVASLISCARQFAEGDHEMEVAYVMGFLDACRDSYLKEKISELNSKLGELKGEM